MMLEPNKETFMTFALRRWGKSSPFKICFVSLYIILILHRGYIPSVHSIDEYKEKDNNNNQDIKDCQCILITTYLKFQSSHPTKQKMNQIILQCFFNI